MVNGQPYVLASGARLKWSYSQPVSEPFRLSGIPLAQDNQQVSRLLFDWRAGIGCARMHRNRIEEDGTYRAYHIGGLLDADLDTAHENAFTLPHLPQTVTHAAGSLPIPQAWANFNG